MASIYANLQKFWEEDDFRCLQTAGAAVNAALRRDEDAPEADPSRKAQAAGTHRYYPAAAVSQNLVHTRSVPIPPLLQQKAQSMKRSTLLGLLSDVALAYLTADHSLYLWSVHNDGSMCSFDVPSGQPIVSVGLVPPRKGVFKDDVLKVLVVTTPEEVLLVAICRRQYLSLVPTHFTVPTDFVRMLKIAGDKRGRIFLGGEDGNIYEIEYGRNSGNDMHLRTVDDRLATFYDGNEVTPATLVEESVGLLGRKRLLSTAATSHPRKCRKLNHGSALTSVLPTFLTPNRGQVVAMATDEERQALYSLTSLGHIFSYRLGDVKEIASLNLLATARSYLEAVGRGQMTPPRHCQFGSGAAAGVGHMAGARAILKVERLLQPRSLHIVPRQESRTITALVVTQGGIRLYLSSIRATQPVSAYSTAAPVRLGSWTLCHMRAPPSLVARDNNNNNNMNYNTGRQHLDACCYESGCFVAAMDHKLLWGAAPDAIRRPVESNTTATSTAIITTNQHNSNHAPPKLELPGGITEALSLPMKSARGSAPLDQADTLPGGVVSDMGILKTSDPIRNLMVCSETPTNGELELDLPPAYFPPRKIKALQQKKSTSTSTALVAQQSTATTALQLVGSVMLGFLGAKQKHLGLRQPNSNGGGAMVVRQRDYRLSKRVATEGFSRTAEERLRKTSSSTTGTSARLRSWLLRPNKVPLAPLVTHHLNREQEVVVALNRDGLHFFSFTNVLTTLADALVAAGDNVAHDQSITEFFSAYGYEEGNAMCLALASGIGKATNGIVGDRAERAALARGFVPKLYYRNTTNGSTTPSSSSGESDPLVPDAYEFESSALYKGITLLVSRLLRPIWHKPCVVVTEGRSLKTAWSTQSPTMTPAKVEVLFDADILEQVRTPLQNLARTMRSVFARAIRGVPGGRTESTEYMEIDDSALITRALQHQSHLRTGDVAEQLSISDLENLAQLLEEKNIHVMYRLVSRTIQLLNLMALLLRTEHAVEFQQVDWGLLHGLTTAQLVQTSEGQDRVETLLNSLITTGGLPNSSMLSADAQRVVTQFADCYLFFSPGSQYAYTGLRLAARAQASELPLQGRNNLTVDAANNLKSAAKHWHSAPLITGRILHRNDNEAYGSIARRAIQCGSPLAVAVEALIQLEDVASVVQVCLITADNFQDDQHKLGNRHANGTLSTLKSVRFDLPWEAQLYHKRRVLDSSTMSVSSPSQTHVQGAAVTNQDAVRTCYALIFYHLDLLLTRKTELADHMVSACSAAADRGFLDSFFSYMYENKHKDTLLRIDSPDLENWIRVRSDTELLWRYYETQSRFVEAGRLMWDHARNPSVKLALDERITSLKRAQRSFASASDTVVQESANVGELLNIASLQSRILREVQKMKSDLPEELTPEKCEELGSRLIDVSELYNDFATALSLWDYCLLILHACHHHETGAIYKTWTYLILSQITPCSTRDPAAYQFLRSFVTGIEVGDDIQLLQGDHAAGDDTIFERGEWAGPLRMRVVRLGQELYGTGADYVFPVTFLLSTLEGLAEHTSAVQPGWALQTLAEAGVPYLVLLDAYEGIVHIDEADSVGGGDTSQRILHWDAIVSLLQHWTTSAQSSSSVEVDPAHRELQREVASGRLQPKIEALRARLETTSGASALLERLLSVEQMIQYLK